MTRATTDGLFVELGYFDPEDYFVYVAEAESAPSSAFTVVCDATEIPGGVVVEVAAALSAAATVAITATKIIQAAAEFAAAFTPTLTVEVFKNHTAALDVAFDLESTAVKTVDPGGLLEFFANLNNAADRFRDNSSAISAEFTVGNNNAIGDIGTNVTFESAASLESVAALSCDAESITYISASAALSATATVAAEGIEYRLRGQESISGQRPLVPYYSDVTFNTFEKFGNYAVNLDGLSDLKIVYHENTIAPNNSEDWFFETWIYPLASTQNFDIFRIDTVGNTDANSQVITLSEANSNDLFLFADDANGVNKLATPSTYTLTDNSWQHLLVTWKPGSGMKIYVNGTQRSSLSENFQIFTTNDPLRLTIGQWTPTTDGNSDSFLLDDTRIVSGVDALVTYGYDFSKTTITVPTTSFVNDTNTKLLLHYENNLRDDDVGIQQFTANLSSSFAQTVAATTIQSGFADIVAESTLSTIVGKIQPAAAEFESVASQLTAVAKIGDFLIDAAVTANFAITPDLFKEYSSSIASEFAQSTDAVKSVEAGADIADQFTMVTENQGTISFVADLVVAFTSNATGATNKPGAADLAAEFTQNSVAIKAVEAAGSAASEFTIAIDNSRTRDNSSAFESVAAQLTAAAKIGDFLIDAAVAANLTVSGNVLTGSVVAIDSAASASITAVKTVVVSSDVAAESQISIDAVVGVVAEGTFESTVNLTIDADVIKRAVVAASSTATLAAAGKVTARANSSMAATASVVAALGRIRPGSSAISSAAQLNINAGKRVSATANLPAVSAVLAVGREVRLDVYVYRIPAESRNATIAREIREYEIRQETRTHSIQGT